MTSSALNIAVGQVPDLIGLNGFSPQDSTYLVAINILTHLNTTTLDAAIGFTALAMFYLIRSACKIAAGRYPNYQRAFFFVSTLRTVVVILLYTLISWLVNRDIKANTKFEVLGNVPRG
jgi:solute carrier family 26 (sodium-independent sulfate anion transporter), member 11